MRESDVGARALYDLATARAGESIDGVRDLVADMISARLEAFDLRAVERGYSEVEETIRGALRHAGYTEDEAAAWAYRLRARVAFVVEDVFAGDALARAENLYHAAAAGADFEATAAALVAGALRRVPIQARPHLARVLTNDLIVGGLAARGGESASVDELWRQARGIERAAMAAAEQGEDEQDAKPSRGAGQLH